MQTSPRTSRSIHRARGAWSLCILFLLLCSAQTFAADRDRDGIADAQDKCPGLAEDFDGDRDEDGCPDDRDSDGDGILDSKDLCPTLPEDRDGDKDGDGCPDLKDDKDRDSVADKADVCPIDPEDRDGFKDEDGCPDIDNDEDNIPDVSDSCPMEAEDFDGVEDEDGCPDVMVVVTEKKIELNDKIYFEYNSSKIDPRSYELLSAVAEVLVNEPGMKVRIEGHTDDKRSDKHNLKLSDDRAKSVALYLVRQGVETRRLIPIGIGERQPVEDNGTEEGRATNRRVEFFILERGS